MDQGRPGHDLVRYPDQGGVESVNAVGGVLT